MAAKCNILTDSCCDFSQADIDEAGIKYLPFTYIETSKPDGGFKGTDDLFQTRSAHEFYQAILDGACPMTSQPSQLAYEEAYEGAIKTGVPTVMFTLSSGISGAYNGAVTALDRVKEKHGGTLPTPIYVVDCLIGSTTQNLFIHAAVKKRDEGLTAEELVKWAEDARFHAHTIFMVDNLDCLHRGGRIPKSAAVVGGLLDVKPLLTFKLDGSLAIIGMARGRRKAMRKMAEFYENNHRTDVCGPVVAVGDADCDADADSLVRMLKPAEHDLKVYRSHIGPTIGCHVGPGMLSCCFWGEDRRKDGYNDAKE
ncbi:MAG: DegV family protein [Tractidigestivibacter sp.]|jgi:DegV family protein with EDD domain|uniref:DegV family protein n=1 Tax=Tractidigestivibacter sp. TaxID=2847320 RepID=UPI003D8EF79B